MLAHTVEARSVIGKLQARRRRDYTAPHCPLRGLNLGLGETASALEWLETALAEREPYLGSLIVFPGYDAIRDQARFMRLTRELRLST